MKTLLKQLSFLEPFIADGAKIMLGLFLFVAVALFLIHGLLAIFFPYPLDYGEAPLIDQAARLAAGQNIYRAEITAPPYTVTNYPPLYILLLAPFVYLAGPGFLAGRLISILSAVASAMFLGLIIYTYTRERLAAAVTGVLFLAIPYVVHWSGLLRVDLFALALSTAALYILVRWPTTRWGLVAAGLLLTAAIYTRQSYLLAAPLAAFVWLWTQERRRAIELAALVGGLSLILFIILNILTRGGFFFNVVMANLNEFDLGRLSQKLTDLAAVAPLLLIFGLAFLFLGRSRFYPWPLLTPYLIGAALAALTIGKIGSNVNYFLELSAALSLAAGALVYWSRQYPWRHIALFILLALQTGWLMQTTLEQTLDNQLTARRGDAAAITDLAGMIAEAGGPVLADEYMGLIPLQNRPLYLQPFEVTQLTRAGRWDQTALLESIEQQTFPLILIHYFPFSLIHEERWTPEILSAIEQHYRPVRMQAGTVVYRPQEEQNEAVVPPPTLGSGFSSGQAQLGPLHRLGRTPYMLQPHLAVNPTNPDHLAAIVTTTSYPECDDVARCQADLLLLTSTDGGATWTEQRPFAKAGEFSTEGIVAFGPDGTLYVLGIRDGTITLNSTHSDAGYEISRSKYQEVTRAQVSARPWLRIDPRSGTLFLSYAAQYREILATPSLNRSTDAGLHWSSTTRADQGVAIADIVTGQVTPPADIQVLLGAGNNLALVWTWSPQAWSWPRRVWLATSADGGESFSTPRQLAETWGAINTAAQNGAYYLVYRPGTEQAQDLALAASYDGGQTWVSSLINGNISLTFDVDKAPGIGVAPDGTIDLVFYAHGEDAAGCALDLASWQETLKTGWRDSCLYHVYYTFSRDGGQSFSQPLQLNQALIPGERFVRWAGVSTAGSHIAVASTEAYAYPIWIEAQDDGAGTQAVTVRIER
jgi:hypothetical protein